MTIIKSARKVINSEIRVSISRIKFDSNNMTNLVEWIIDNPLNEEILSYDFIIFENDTSPNRGSFKNVHELSPSANKYIHRNIEIISKDPSYFRTYSYQVIAYTNTTSKASEIEKFDPREIYEVEPPKQITFSIKSGHAYFSIKCNQTKFTTNIFVFKKHFDDDVFERIAVLNYDDELLFIDNNVSLGHFYEYRFMSYDLFGHFSQNIVKIDVFVWDKNYSSSKTTVLFDPIPLAQYAKESSNNQYIKLKVSNIDPRCSWYKIERQDVSEKRNTFSEVENWASSGLIYSNGNTEIEFLDSVVRSGSFYRYSVFGLDKHSNKTDTRQSNVVYCGLLYEMPASPINVSGQIINAYPTAVRLDWTDDNLNQKLSDIVSGSSDLFPKQNLYYFKVFRRKYDELNYRSFPEQSQSFFIDSCDDDGVASSQEHPYYQPEPPMRDTKYYYYIATYDSSTNAMSNKSNELLVDLTVPPSQVTNVEAYFNDTFEPLKCILTWKTDENEKTLDSFLIERIEDDKLWIEMGKSYFNTQFVDTSIKRGKKYIYRIRGIDFNKNMGKYSYIAVNT
jgi:hypothetical protein